MKGFHSSLKTYDNFTQTIPPSISIISRHLQWTRLVSLQHSSSNTFLLSVRPLVCNKLKEVGPMSSPRVNLNRPSLSWQSVPFASDYFMVGPCLSPDRGKTIPLLLLGLSGQLLMRRTVAATWQP